MRYLSPSGVSNEGRASLSLQPSDCVYSMMISNSAAKTFEIPEGANHAVFSSTVDFFVLFGDVDIDDAAVPTADVMDGSAPEMSPGMRSFDDEEITHMSVIGIEAGQLTISFYKG